MIWEVHDYAEELGPTLDEAGAELTRRMARATRPDPVVFSMQLDANAAALAESTKCCPVGDPTAMWRAFVPRDPTLPPRRCRLSTESDHRWYPSTIELQWVRATNFVAFPPGQFMGKESADRYHLVPVMGRRNGVGIVFEDDDGHLWLVLDRRYKSRNKVKLSDPGTGDQCEARVFQPWEHVAAARVFKFPGGAGRHAIGASIAAEFEAAHPSGSARDYSLDISGSSTGGGQD